MSENQDEMKAGAEKDRPAKKVTLSVWIDPDVYTRFKQIAYLLGMTASELLRREIDTFCQDSRAFRAADISSLVGDADSMTPTSINISPRHKQELKNWASTLGTKIVVIIRFIINSIIESNQHLLQSGDKLDRAPNKAYLNVYLPGKSYAHLRQLGVDRQMPVSEIIRNFFDKLPRDITQFNIFADQGSDEPLQRANLCFSSQFKDEVESLAKNHGVKSSRVIRAAVMFSLDQLLYHTIWTALPPK